MSDFHVLWMNETQDKVKVVYHIPISSASVNSANLTYRDVLILHYDLSNFVSKVPWIELSGSELDQLKNCELFEYSEVFQFSNGKNGLATKRAELENRYSEIVSKKTTELQKRFQFYGINRDV